MTTPHTLAVDCGGTGVKAMVLDAAGEPASPRVKRRTPYPCSPAVLVSAVSELAAQTGVDYDRVSVGFPGMVRNGVVYATPHYVTEAGPFTPVRPDLVKEWQEFDVRAALEAVLRRPTRVLNDAEIAGLAVIEHRGFEVHGAPGAGMREAVSSEGGWPEHLEHYRRIAA